MSNKIRLNYLDQLYCYVLAAHRNQNNRKKGIFDKKIGPQSAAMTDLEGIGGEFAYCRLFGYLPDLTLYPRGSGKGDKGDIVTEDGTIIDVKTTKYRTGRLLAPMWKSRNTDIFVLMVGSFPTYEYRGEISADDLMQSYNICDLGYGDTWGVTQDKLKVRSIETTSA